MDTQREKNPGMGREGGDIVKTGLIQTPRVRHWENKPFKIFPEFEQQSRLC